MDSNRRAALSAGLLFITATVASVAGTALSGPLLGDPVDLAEVAANANKVTGGALLALIAAVASAGIAISLYPVLKRWSSGLALGSVVFRAAEAIMYLVGVASLLSVVALSQRFTAAGGADAASLRAIGDSLLDVREQVGLMGVFAFGLGALLYYYLFYQSRLIPRWLSGWGLLAIVLTLGACVMALFSQRPITTYVLVMLPIAVQEMVFAVWLIARGFDPAALRSSVEERDAGSARAGTTRQAPI